MKTSLALVAVILFQIQVVFSKPSISKYNSDSEKIGYYESSKFEPNKEFEPSHLEFSFGDFSSPIELLREENHEPNNTTDIPNEIIENETYDDSILEENDNDDIDNATKLSKGKYGSDMKTVIKTFLTLLPKNTTLTHLFEEVADVMKTVPNEAITNSTIIDQNRRVIT